MVPADQSPTQTLQNRDASALHVRKTAGDAAINVSERLVSLLLQFGIFILAARLLGPAEFGIFALVSACAILLLRVAEAGWGPYIMARPEGSETPYQVLTMALLAGLSVGLFGFALSFVADRVAVTRNVVPLIQLFTVWIAMTTLSTAQKGILIWLGRLKSAALIEMIAELIGFGVAAVTLFQGAGIYALIYGKLSYQFTLLVLSFAVTRRAPMLGISSELRRDLLVFSGQFLTIRLMSNARLHFVTLTIGLFLGPEPVGYFRAAERLVGAAFEVIAVPAQLLAWTLLRRARDIDGPGDSASRMERQVGQHLKVLMAMGIPVLLWLTVLHHDIVVGLLGPEWAPAGVLVGILALGTIAMLPGVLTEPLITLSGEARRLPRFTAIIFALSISATLLAAPFGVLVLALSKSVLNVVIMFITLRFIARHASIHWSEITIILRDTVPPLIIGLGAIVAFYISPIGLDIPRVVRAVLVGLAGGVVYAFALALFDRPFWAQIASAFTVRPGKANGAT